MRETGGGCRIVIDLVICKRYLYHGFSCRPITEMDGIDNLHDDCLRL